MKDFWLAVSMILLWGLIIGITFITNIQIEDLQQQIEIIERKISK